MCPVTNMAWCRAFPVSCSGIFRTILKWLQLTLLLLASLLFLRSTVRSLHSKVLSTSIWIAFKNIITVVVIIIIITVIIIIIIIIIIIMSWGGNGGGGKLAFNSW